MIKKIIKKYKTLVSVKEAFDNLPAGAAYFDDRGTPLLINKMMYYLIFSLVRCELQSLSDLDEMLKKHYVFMKNGTVWHFSRKVFDNFTEVTATDITELYFRKIELEKANKEQKDIMKRMKRITENVVSIARNEEILAMKMYVHNELGYALSASRLFIRSGCEDKEKYVDVQRKTVKMLIGEVGNTDETDVFSELMESAEQLGMKIEIEGAMPKSPEGRRLLSSAVRECLVNTVRHAGGDKVFVKAHADGGKFTAVITNNGNPPENNIKEGGGLSSLRRKLEENGGSLEIHSSPVFSACVTFPMKESDKL